jgi:hypothetical protein
MSNELLTEMPSSATYGAPTAFKSPDSATMLPSMIRRICILALIGLFHAGAADAQTPSEVATFKAWSAYKLKQDRGTACYMASQPSASAPNTTGEILAGSLTRHWPRLKAKS